MKIQPIHTKAAYRAALKRLSSLIDADPKRGTALGDELEVWGALVQSYEAQHYPIDLPDPIEAIKFRMEQQGLTSQRFATHDWRRESRI